MNDVGNADWNAAIKASKFNPEKFPSFGKAPKGYLGIQGDHPGTLALREHQNPRAAVRTARSRIKKNLKVERPPQRLYFKSLA